ncbi:hypothetical protein EKO27_g4045 [Xylaria grammica]|uniref:Uncharacterized protein n=1 Tax=Xylaria grammica TaxID=363999 RepID=A0A439D9G8_9PEZI|nr:hypothetical protein EKO27_g4045 [Xylaria grammica]
MPPLLPQPRKAPSDTTQERGAAPKAGIKRQPADHDSTTKAEAEGRKRAKTSKSTEPEEEQRPRLTTPDLEFDYDQSQLRDPRPTPGRVRRPRLRGGEATEEFKQQFFIPKPERPKGRLNAYQKNLLYEEQALLDPAETFHDLYVCHKRGPYGEPTYDAAGFQLDFGKVAEWKKPTAYNRSRMVKGTLRGVERQNREERELFEIFFVHGDAPDSDHGFNAKNYVKDHISKDLGVPWHQINASHAREWLQKGFQKKKFSEWWREPNNEERKRMAKMMEGASLRKDL